MGFYAGLINLKEVLAKEMEKDKFSDFERRKFPRLKDNIFIIGNLRSGQLKEFKAVTKDISVGGLMFETEKDILKDMRLDLEIYQPRDGRKSMIFSVPVLARAVWIKEIEKNNLEEGENKYRIGIEFLEIKEGDRQRIAKYVEERLPLEK